MSMTRQRGEASSRKVAFSGRPITIVMIVTQPPPLVLTTMYTSFRMVVASPTHFQDHCPQARGEQPRDTLRSPFGVDRPENKEIARNRLATRQQARRYVVKPYQSSTLLYSLHLTLSITSSCPWFTIPSLLCVEAVLSSLTSSTKTPASSVVFQDPRFHRAYPQPSFICRIDDDNINDLKHIAVQSHMTCLWFLVRSHDRQPSCPLTELVQERKHLRSVPDEVQGERADDDVERLVARYRLR
jgi:hypothetical protein